MSTIGVIYTGGILTLTMSGVSHQVHPENQYLEDIWVLVDDEELTDEDKEEKILALLVNKEEEKIKALTSSFSEEDVKVVHGLVTVRGEPAHGTIVNKIFEFSDQKRNPKSLVRFMANLSENPSEHSKEQLYDFLENAGFPITTDGHFLAYKGVKDNLWDKHTGETFKYEVGAIIEMPRHLVCADPNRACAAGIHVGSIKYATHFASQMVLLKVNPRDAVSVPSQETEKLRVCRAEVIRLHESKRKLLQADYTDEELELGDEEFLENEEALEEELAGIDPLQEIDHTPSYDTLHAKFSKINRDDVCRLACSKGYFFSTNEARHVGKGFVVEVLTLGGLPTSVGWEPELVSLAERRNIEIKGISFEMLVQKLQASQP